MLSGTGLATLIFGMTLVGRGIVEHRDRARADVLRHAACSSPIISMRAKRNIPILDLSLLKVPTFRASLTGGSLFRVGVGATPLLLPLMLQVGFGLNAFQSGSITFITSIGAMAMKTTAAPILRTFGFRHVLLFNSLLSATHSRLLWILHADDAAPPDDGAFALRRFFPFARIHQRSTP